MPAVRLSLLCMLVGLLAALPALAAPKMQTFHIDAGDATFTLNEFSRQSSLQLLFDYNIVRGRRTRAISGEFEAAAALQQMLTDTGLIFDFVNERTLAVTLNGRPGGAGSAVAEASRPPSRTQSAETQSVTHEGAGSGSLGIDPKAIELQEITILGTHLHGEEPVGEHVVHLGREDINNSPAGTVQDLLRTFPQTFGGGPTEDTHFFSAETTTNSGLGSGINLRALGAKATLVLINGKRMAPSGTDAAFSDIENIPIAAVERMDILSDGASAVYGSDAVGGVVNFVMRDNFTGAETLLRGGSGTQNTLQEYQASQTLGTRWDSGNAMVSLEFYKRSDLPAYARRYTNSNLTSLGGSNFDVTTTNPGNLITNFGDFYAIPRGQNGTSLGIGDLLANSANLGNRYEGADILPSQKRCSLYAAGKHALSDSVSVYGNALASRREAEQSNGGYLAPLLAVPASNAFFPAGITSPPGVPNSAFVQYNFLDDLGPYANDVIVNNFNVTAGVDIAVSSAWKLNLYGNYAQEKENQLTTGLPDTLALAQALADSNPTTAFNPFGDGSHTNPATLAAIRTSSRYYTNSRLRTANITADGPIATLPGGDLKLALGVDHRNQVYATLQSATSSSPAQPLNGSRNVTAAFGELRIPVFGKANAHTGLAKLEFSLAGRYEKYSDFGNATTPKLGVAWSPLDAVAFRGTWGRSIRAPTLAELSTTLNRLAVRPVPDNSAPQGVALALFETGNSPDITVERARTWTAGFDVDAARWVPGLIFSATYFNINFRDRIQGPTFGLNVLNDPTYASFVTHNPTAAQLQAACSQGTFLDVGSCTASGATAIIDVRNHNLASVRTSGIDLNAFYERHWAPGTLKIRLDGTWLRDFTQQAFPDAPAVQLLNTQNNPMNVKLRSVLTWQQVHWGASLGINFQNHYQDVASQPSRSVRSLTTFDAQLRYAPPTFGSSLLENTALELNAVNVFNSSPPFLNNATAGLGYDQENADPTGRLLSIQVRKNW